MPEFTPQQLENYRYRREVARMLHDQRGYRVACHEKGPRRKRKKKK